MPQKNKYSLKVIEEVYSPISGRLLVTTNDLLGLNVINENKIAISGDVMAEILSKPVRELNKSGYLFKNSLILGFGVGKTAYELSNLWPKMDITGVEIDATMISLGKKYFGLGKSNVNIEIIDASEFLKKSKEKLYDLVIVDIFLGDKVPEKFEKNKFIKLLLKTTKDNGFVLFNRINSKNDLFAERAKSFFKNSNCIIYRNNLLITCQK